MSKTLIYHDGWLKVKPKPKPLFFCLFVSKPLPSYIKGLGFVTCNNVVVQDFLYTPMQ